MTKHMELVFVFLSHQTINLPKKNKISTHTEMSQTGYYVHINYETRTVNTQSHDASVMFEERKKKKQQTNTT